MKKTAGVIVAVVLATASFGGCSSSSSSSPAAADDAGTKPRDGSVSALDGASTTAPDGASTPDGETIEDATPAGCGEYAGDTRFTCSADGNSRGKCVGDASADVEACPNGCLRETPPADDICMGTTDTLTCPGSYGTVPSQDGDYYLTAFGCWVDDAGVHTDPDDNCIPACLSKAIAAGLCMPGDTGPACEERVTWYTADGARFGCLAKLRVTNPLNGKSLIAVALDYGPACSIENKVGEEALDASGRVDDYLFGEEEGSVDKAQVHVVQVDDATLLGPIP